MQEVISMVVKAGTNGNKVHKLIPNGKVVQSVIYTPVALNNTGFVRASILDGSESPLSKLQDIRNYRSREAGYFQNKPLFINGGQNIHLEVIATQNFSADTLIELILDYDVASIANPCNVQ